MENSFTASKLFLTLMKVSGLFPMSFVGSPQKGNLKVRPSNVILTSVSFTILICSTALSMVWESFGQSYSSLLLKSWNFIIKIELFSMVFLFGVQIHKRNFMLKFLEQVELADSKVTKR